MTSTVPPLPGGFSPLQPGDPHQIGPFGVVGRIGAGGMGAVYGALGSDGAHVAVKVILPRFADDPQYRAQFAREAELLARVGAECAPAFHGADAAADPPWIATSFVSGRTLKEHIADVGVLSGDALLSLAAGTAEALAAVHAAGVLHCDVKPGNIMLSPDGPRVLDFGIARGAEDASSDPEVYGTPGWISPERLGGAPPTDRSDVFAWAGLVVFAATGRGPYGGGTTAELLERARTGEADAEGVPAELLPVVRAALNRDPAARPSADEAMRAVLALVSGPEEEREADARTKLRGLLSRAWHGFPSMDRGAGRWIAAGAAATAGGAAGVALSTAALAPGTTAGGTAATSTGAAAVASGSATAGGLGGVSTAALITGGAALLVTVVAGSWIAGRVSQGEPILPGPAASSEPAPEEGGGTETQEVAFGELTLEVPEEWTVHRYERTYEGILPGSTSTAGETVVLGTDPDTECAEPDGNWGYFACPNVELVGEAGIEVGSAASPVTPELAFLPPTEPFSCEATWSVEPATPPEEGGGTSLEPLESATQDIDGSPAEYRVWESACYDNGTQDAPSTEGTFSTYEQRYWFLEDIGVLVVDNHATGGLPEIMENAEVS